jgi:hypothetical protein
MNNYAFIKNQIVTNLVLFDNPTPELLEQFKNKYAADEVVLTPHFYVETLDSYINGKFIAKNNFNGWIFNEEQYFWEPPVPYPRDGLIYTWNNETLSWV